VTVKHWPSQRKHEWVVIFRQGGKRQARYFAGRGAAKTFAQEKEIELINEGRRHGAITDKERRAVATAREHGFDLTAVVEHYAAHFG
jgi:predicted DNA binding protein